MLVDYHIHSAHSVDADIPMRRMALAAAEVGLAEIAITDHFDMNPADEGAGLFDAERWFADLQGTRDESADRLTVRAGVETSEPHECAADVKALSEWPFDFLVGAVHYIGAMGVHADLFDELPLDRALDAYFDVAFNIASCGLVDVLGHFDYFQRYTLERGMPPFDPRTKEQNIRRVLQAVIDNGLALEVNTSGMRQRPGVCFPGQTILRWYHAMGGRAVTIGSDAHRVEHIGANLTDAVTMLDEIGFKSLCVFENRQRREIPLPGSDK